MTEAFFVVLLVLHFGFWAWLTGCYMRPSLEINLLHTGILSFFFWSIYMWAFPLFGFLASLAWGLSVKNSSSTERREA
jgi:hypothetical protein